MKRPEVIQKIMFLGKEICLKNGNYFVSGDKKLYKTLDLAKEAILNAGKSKNG